VIWTEMIGTYELHGHRARPCTFFKASVKEGDLKVRGSHCWATGIFVENKIIVERNGPDPAIENPCWTMKDGYKDCFNVTQPELNKVDAVYTPTNWTDLARLGLVAFGKAIVLILMLSGITSYTFYQNKKESKNDVMEFF